MPSQHKEVPSTSVLTHLRHLQSPAEQSREGKLARAVFYFFSSQSTRVSVTKTKKRPFSFGNRCQNLTRSVLFSSVPFIQIVFTAEQKLIWKFVNAFPAAPYQELLHNGTQSSTQPCTKPPSAPTRDHSQRRSRTLAHTAAGGAGLGLFPPPLPSASRITFPHNIFYCWWVSRIIQEMYM